MDRPLAARRSLVVMIVFSGLTLAVTGSARAEMDRPVKNPFGQPDILKYKPPVTTPRSNTVSVDENNVPELKLTATLISVSEPMVIVNERLLQVGEEIEGMELMLVDEGRAVFKFRGKLHTFTFEDGNNVQTR